MKKKFLTGLATGLFMLGMASMANADPITIFDNFGSPPGYKTCGQIGFTVGPLTSFGDNVVAALFVPSATAYLSFFDVPIWNSGGNENTVMQFSLVGDSAGEPGMVPIETYLLTLGPTNSRDAYSVNSAFNPLLSAGENYWLVATSPEKVGWLYTTSNDTTGFAYTWNYGVVDWHVSTPEVGEQIALRASGESVPIPTTILLLGSGIGGLAAFRKKFNKS